MSDGIDIAPWSGLEVVAPATGGHRSEVWRGRIGSRDVSIRRSGRGLASLEWELDLLATLADHGFVVPTIVETDDGRRHVDGLVVQDWLVGREPAGEADWLLVAAELDRLHRLTGGHPQRPDCCGVGELGTVRRSVDADLDAIPADICRQILAVLGDYADVEMAVIHGDVAPGNIRLDDAGQVGLLDWDESRVDVVWHDLSNLGVVVLPPSQHLRAERLSNAWEAANGWVVEPLYAARRLRALDRAGDRASGDSE